MPFRTAASIGSPCNKCGVLGADLFDVDGSLVCRACFARGEPGARLSTARRAVMLGAGVGTVVGGALTLSALLLGSCLLHGWDHAEYAARSGWLEMWLFVRLVPVLLFVLGIAIMGSCVRNLARIPRRLP